MSEHDRKLDQVRFYIRKAVKGGELDLSPESFLHFAAQSFFLLFIDADDMAFMSIVDTELKDFLQGDSGVEAREKICLMAQRSLMSLDAVTDVMNQAYLEASEILGPLIRAGAANFTDVANFLILDLERKKINAFNSRTRNTPPGSENPTPLM